jgi:chitodextrinase
MARQAPRARRAFRRACLLVVLLGIAALPMAAAPPPPAAGARLVVTSADPGPDVATAPGLGVTGNLLMRDGEPFLPAGFNLIGLLSPSWCDMPETEAGTAAFGPAEFDAAKTWHADTLRFQVSQRGLADPEVSQEDRDAYLTRVLSGVELARAAGFVVVVSMQDQRFGCGDVQPLPTAQTVDAWSVLAPPLMADPYIMFELFNEPQNLADAAGWAQWKDGGTTPDANLGEPAVGHQELVDHLRALGSTNVLIADAARLGERTVGMPRLSDPAGSLVYGIHPYYFTKGLSWWEAQYGDAAAEVPLLATEWNYRADGCRTSEEKLAPALLDYLRRHHIGVLGHAFDAPGTTVADLSWEPTECGTAVGGSGRLLQTFFAGLGTLDLRPPEPPRDLRVQDLDAAHVQLGWTAATDDVGLASYLVVRNGAVVGRPTDPGWTDPTVRPATTYTYTVRSVDTAGNVSGNAVAVAVLTPGPEPDTTPPTAPGTVTVRVLSPTQVALRWSAATDAAGVTGYRVRRDSAAAGTVTGLSFTDTGMTAGPHTYGVEAVDRAGNVSPASSALALVPAPAPRGLTGTYFDNDNFTAQRLVRTDATVAFSWGTGRPASAVGPEAFSVRWTGRLLPVVDGTYTISAASDEGVRVWIDGRPVVDDWTAHPLREARGTVALSADRSYDLRVEYFDRKGTAAVTLSWSAPGLPRQVVPAAQLLAR